MFKKLLVVDHKLIDLMNQHVPRWPLFNFVAKLINLIGNGGLMWLLLALFLIIVGEEPTGYMIIFGDLFYFVVCHQLIKKLIVRKRPFQDNPSLKLVVKAPSSSSFPSGHGTISFASAIILFNLNPLYGWLAVIFSLVVGLSRVYLFLHYPSDVLAGLLIGLVDGMLAYYVVGLLLN